MSFLNTVPLVWGMLRGPQRGAFDLRFEIPSVCADQLASGAVDIGIVPCAELDRLGLDYLPDVGIACRGAVRSILLISRVPVAKIRSLATDVSSRTSAMLARIILAERYGVTPTLTAMKPELNSMLEAADAALIIGDPALALEPATLPYQVLDLGQEWLEFSGLPMVFAVWAGRPESLTVDNRQVFIDSCQYGLAHLEEIAGDPDGSRGFPAAVVREYLTKYIRFQLGPEELRGLEAYRRLVAAMRQRDVELVAAR